MKPNSASIALSASSQTLAAVIDVPVGSGHVVMFSNNPVYRGETVGSYSLVLNTILNFDSLDAGRKLAENIDQPLRIRWRRIRARIHPVCVLTS